MKELDYELFLCNANIIDIVSQQIQYPFMIIISTALNWMGGRPDVNWSIRIQGYSY